MYSFYTLVHLVGDHRLSVALRLDIARQIAEITQRVPRQAVA